MITKQEWKRSERKVTMAGFCVLVLNKLGLLKNVSDEAYLKLMFKARMGQELNLEEPKTICEKIQWLKLYNRRPEYHRMADKYSAKKFAAEKVGWDHVIPAYGVWDRFDDIDFDALPDQFVLKCTHDSGGYVVCADKASFNMAAARKKLNWHMNRVYDNTQREWVYRGLKPRILAEKYIPTLGRPDSVEYKISCFDGKVGFVTICQGIAHARLDQRTNDHYDPDFNKLDWWTYYKPAAVAPAKPEQWEELIAFAEQLSQGIPYVRVDTYIIEGNIFFGEMTFYTWGGFMQFHPPEWGRKLGDKIRLPEPCPSPAEEA